MKVHATKALQALLYSSSVLNWGFASASPIQDVTALSKRSEDYSHYINAWLVPWYHSSNWDRPPTVQFLLYSKDPSKSPRGRGTEGSDGGTWEGAIDLDTVGIVIPMKNPLFTIPLSDLQAKGYIDHRFDSSTGIVREGYWYNFWTQFLSSTNGVGSIFSLNSMPVFVVTAIFWCNGQWDSKTHECDSKGRSMYTTDINMVKQNVPVTLGIGMWSPVINKYPATAGEGNPFAVPYNEVLGRQPNTCNGYVLTRRGVYIGLNSLSAPNFQTKKCTAGAGGFWKNPLQSLTIGGVKGNLPISISLSNSQTAVQMKGLKNAVQSATVTILDDNQQTMASVSNVPESPATASKLLLGTDVLKNYDYLHDNTNGYIGFRPAQ